MKMKDTFIHGSRSFRSTLAFFMLACLLASPLSAVEIHPQAGTTAAAFLKLGIGARAVSMGGAFTGLADDSSALYWNPAGLARLTRQEAGFTHNESFEGIRHDFLGYVRPLENGVLAAGVYGLYTPNDLERRSGLNENDPYEPLSPVEGYFQAYDMAAHLSFARFVRENLSLGASVKLIQQTIDNVSAYSAAADLGLLYRCARLPLSLGFTAQHMGMPVKFRDRAFALPFVLKGGGAYRWNKRLVTTLDLEKAIDDFLFVSAGAEYAPLELLSLRAGYRYRTAGQEPAGLSGLSAGAGFNFRVRELDLRMNYSFVPFGVLGDSHRVSFGLLFGAETQRRPAGRRENGRENKAEAPAPAPAAPADPDAGAPAGNGEYAFYPFTVSSKLMRATGRMTIFALTGTSDKSELSSWKGLVKGAAPAPRCEVGEKKGEGKVYKYFRFKDVSVPLERISCTLRLPGELAAPLVITEDGETIEPLKVSQDETHALYRFSLETPKDFRVEAR
ncbi:MAG: PorV/PorQ family protein [Endomicrobiales bacterium]